MKYVVLLLLILLVGCQSEKDMEHLYEEAKQEPEYVLGYVDGFYDCINNNFTTLDEMRDKISNTRDVEVKAND